MFQFKTCFIMGTGSPEWIIIVKDFLKNRLSLNLRFEELDTYLRYFCSSFSF